jgi:integrase
MRNSVQDDKSYGIVMDDNTFKAWYKDLATQRVSTAESYKYGLISYCKFTGKAPADLIQEAYDDYGKKPWEQRHQKYYEDFVQTLREDTIQSKNTKLNRIKAVKNFYLYHKILLIPVRTGIPNAPSERYLDIPLLKIEDIRKAILTVGTNKLLKALILTLLSSGQAQGEIRQLKGKHLKNIVNGVAVVNMTRGKTNRRYTFFIGKEALDAIHEHKPKLKDDEYVFSKQADRTKPLIPQEIDNFLCRHAEKVGLDRSYFAPHRVRHFFKTVMTGNLDHTYLEYILAHKLPGVESSYFIGQNLDKMLEAYVKNQHLLTVFTDKEVLQKQYDELKQNHDSETERIKKELSTMQEQMKALIIAMSKAEKQKV